MDFDCSKKTACIKKFCAYCCAYKRDLIRNNNFEKTIEILPRIIVCQKFERCGSYHQPLTVRNMGTLTRKMKFVAEPGSDISFNVNGNTELTSGASVSIDIYVEPTKKKCINRNRFFYILAEHPDIVWEIPIIVIGDPPQVFVPELICLHKVPANTISNYQFVIYNPFENEISFSIQTKFEEFTINPLSKEISGKDYCKILISAKIPDKLTTMNLVVTLHNGKKFRVCICMEPSDQIIYLSTRVLTFQDTYLGLRAQKNIYICNKSMENAGFRWTCSETGEDIATDNKGKADEELIINSFLRIRNRCGCIAPLNSSLSIVTFTPPADFDYNEEEDPPFRVNVSIYLQCPMMGTQSYQLEINASIIGADIQISPKDTDVGDVYMGQIQCFKFDVFNRGPIPGKVYFKDHTDQEEINVLFFPQSRDLKPSSRAVFNLKFFRCDIGKFLTKLTFKIKCGNTLPILLRGNSLATTVNIWPPTFEFGNVPICIPQKRFALVSNPLPVPLVVEPMVVDDGEDDPLILCVDYSKLPLNARPASFYKKRNSKFHYKSIPSEEIKPSYSDFGLDGKESSITASSGQLSWMFQDKVLDDVPAMAEALLQSVKTLQSYQQPEPGMKIIDAALDCLLDRSDYFEDLKYKQNYLNMDWQTLPSDAKEVGIEVERFYLNPNESKSFPIVLVPNSSGPGLRSIEFKACPMGTEQTELRAAVRSKYMVNTLNLNYNCIVPTLQSTDHVKFPKPLYVDKEHNFAMKFRNIDTVPGFVYFKVIPRSIIGALKIKESERKFFIAPKDEIVVACSVTFRQVGFVTLRGLFQLIGKLIEYPFSVEAEVVPPKIKIIPNKVSNKQQVLELTRTKIIIENISPTIAKFSVSLKNKRYQFLEPLGGSLAPNQKILISVFTKYFDPGMYKNILFINLMHANKLCIQISTIVEGTPLKFEPNIKLGIDFGSIFRTNGTKNTPVCITNCGEKSYRLLFIKQKPKKQSLIPAEVFDIEPKGLTIEPNGERHVNVSLDVSKELSANEHYSVDGMGEDNCRFKYFSFTAKCTIMNSKVVWSKNPILLEAGNPNEACDKLKDTVSLINTTALATNVKLSIVGHFLISDMTGTLKSSFDLCLEGKATKQFTIWFDEYNTETKEMCQCFKGSVKCKVNGKTQKPLLIHAKIVNPGLKICTPDVTFFSQHAESYSHIYIQNCSPLKVHYTWNLDTLALTKTVFSEDYETLYTKTISEMILSLPENDVLKIPTFIIPQSPEADPPDENISEEEDTVIVNQSNLNTKSSAANTEVISKKAPSSMKTTNTKKSQGTSKKASVVPNTAQKKVSLVIERPIKPCQPFSIKFETEQVGINRVLDYLGYEQKVSLESSKTINVDRGLEMGDMIYEEKDKCTQNLDEKLILFQHQSGYILPKALLKAYIFLPPIEKGNTLVSKFHLKVTGGQTETLNATITSLKGRVEISKTEIDLGSEVWHKTITDKIQLTNHNPYAVKITVFENSIDPEQELIFGHVRIASPKMFILLPGSCTSLEWKVVLGLGHTFIEDIGIEINNNSTAIAIRFIGTGLMPIITPINLNPIAGESLNTVASYLTIRTIFENIQAKKTASHINSGFKATLPLFDSKVSTSLTKDIVFSEDGLNTTASKRKPSSEFVALHYSEDVGPTAKEIERSIETLRFTTELNNSEDLRKKFHKYYCDCVCLRAMEVENIINLKFAICRPIPWELPVFGFNLGELQTKDTYKFQLDLTFTGPGKVYLSARTKTVIPGLTAWFEESPFYENPSPFIYLVQCQDESTAKIYRNMNERNQANDNVANQETVRLTHAHSYDMDESGTHMRQKTTADSKKIKEQFTKFSQPFKERKSDLVLAEVCQITDENWDNSVFKLNLMIIATDEFYENEQIIEDYLLIDMHLGPTLPILLRGNVITNQFRPV